MDANGKCDGHCENCTINQRSYCAAQMAYYNQQEIAAIKAILANKDNEMINPIGRIETPLKSEEIAEEDD